jgi:hypothetical protein
MSFFLESLGNFYYLDVSTLCVSILGSLIFLSDMTCLDEADSIPLLPSPFFSVSCFFELVEGSNPPILFFSSLSDSLCDILSTLTELIIKSYVFCTPIDDWRLLLWVCVWV